MDSTDQPKLFKEVQIELLALGEKFCDGPRCPLNLRIIAEGFPSVEVPLMGGETITLCWFCMRQISSENNANTP